MRINRVSVLVSFSGSEKRGRFFAQLARAGSRLAFLLVKIKGAGEYPAPSHIHSIYSRGKAGQVSNPEQNASVKEAAGPSHNLLPASSKAASGTSSPCKTPSS